MKPSDTDKLMADAILTAYRKGFTVKSDYARMHADYIGMAASMGLISTKLYGNIFSSEWRPTSKGLHWLEEVFGVEIEDDSDNVHEGYDDQ